MAKRTLALEEIASEVGRLFGTTEKHAKKWLEQRKTLLHALEIVRDNANHLIGQLGESPLPWGPTKKKRGRPAKVAIPDGQPEDAKQSRQKRRMSAATRAKMAAAQRKP